MELSSDQRRLLLDVARAVIRRVLSGRDLPAASDLPDGSDDPALLQPAGCFVTLHAAESHRLRGCVGRLDATLPLLEAVRSTAESVLEDPRFLDDPVRLDELPGLELEISVVSPLRPVPHPLDFDPDVHGIYLTIAGRSGCFLPQVAQETGWGREQLLDRLCTEKMGLPPEAWRGPRARLSVFTTLTLGPEPFVPPGSI